MIERTAGVHERFMRECLRLAEKGKGFVSPNPLVGALLVVSNRIVSRGYHKRFGGPHAEVECLRKYKGNTSAATLYVSLEPCSHYGKTPPCTELILSRGIKRVIVAMKDPNPLVGGKGIRLLRKAGVEVISGILQSEARHQNRFFLKHITTQLPYVHVKISQTMDGFIARERGKESRITSKDSQKLVHQWRTEHDAILVGAGTIKSDNPQLNVRLVHGRAPVVVILDGALSISGTERIFSSTRGRSVYLCTSEASVAAHPKKASSLLKKGVQILGFRSSSTTLKITDVLKRLYEFEIGSILVEGGSYVFTEFSKQNLIDELSIFFSPKTFGDGVPVFTDDGAIKRRLGKLIVERGFVAHKLGPDFLLTGQIH